MVHKNPKVQVKLVYFPLNTKINSKTIQNAKSKLSAICEYKVFSGTTLTWLLWKPTAPSSVSRTAASTEFRWSFLQSPTTGLTSCLNYDNFPLGHLFYHPCCEPPPVPYVLHCSNSMISNPVSSRWVVLADSLEFRHMDEDIESLKCFCDGS